jgi:hypothetical protein
MNANINQINFGFGIAMLFMTAWLNMQPQRFMRLWLRPPYKPLTILLFRLFFAANLVGACWNLAQKIFQHGGPISGYLSGVEIGLVMCAVIWCMFSLVLWMVRKQEAKS